MYGQPIGMRGICTYISCNAIVVSTTMHTLIGGPWPGGVYTPYMYMWLSKLTNLVSSYSVALCQLIIV